MARTHHLHSGCTASCWREPGLTAAGAAVASGPRGTGYGAAKRHGWGRHGTRSQRRGGHLRVYAGRHPEISHADQARRRLHAHGAVRRGTQARLRRRAGTGNHAEDVPRRRGGSGTRGVIRVGDLAVLVVIERQHGEVGGLPDQDWSLRVTWVFRREGPEWRLVHRHADPL